MGPSPRKLILSVALCATVTVGGGCGRVLFAALVLSPPSGVCEVESSGEIVFEGNGPFAVPDQLAGACNSVEISTHYADSFQRDLLLSAETAGSTVSMTWYDPDETVFDLLLPNSIGAEALRYYVERSDRLEAEFPTLGLRSELVYKAEVSGPVPVYIADDATYGDVFVVELALAFTEWANKFFGSGVGIIAHRTVLFDSDSRIVAIFGDGDDVGPVNIN